MAISVALVASVAEAGIDAPYFLDDSFPNRMLQIENAVQRPVKVVRHVRGLLPESVGRVRQDSPGTSPAKSTAKSWPHEGQVTAASVWPV